MSAADPIDAQLAREARAGSLASFDRLVGRHHEKVFAFLLTLTRHRQDAEDLTQETFLRAWRKIKSYDPERPLTPWLLTIARRLSIGMLRKKKPVPMEASELPEIAVMPERSPSMTLWHHAEKHLTREAYSALWLHYREELPLAEVGKVLGKSEGAAKVLVHRARKTLGECLRKRSSSPPPLPITPPPLPSIWNAKTTP
ncbi:MAG: RNA polymerase sigma factor [Verrucomicrobiota bacterium]